MITILARLVERWTEWEARQRADAATDIGHAMILSRWTFNPKESV